jgi:hypothetical protein
MEAPQASGVRRPLSRYGQQVVAALAARRHSGYAGAQCRFRLEGAAPAGEHIKFLAAPSTMSDSRPALSLSMEGGSDGFGAGFPQ